MFSILPVAVPENDDTLIVLSDVRLNVIHTRRAKLEAPTLSSTSYAERSNSIAIIYRGLVLHSLLLDLTPQI